MGNVYLKADLPGDSPRMTEPFLTFLGGALGLVLLVILFSMIWDQQNHKRRKD
jgi:hypothetical protein